MGATCVTLPSPDLCWPRSDAWTSSDLKSSGNDSSQISDTGLAFDQAWSHPEPQAKLSARTFAWAGNLTRH